LFLKRKYVIIKILNKNTNNSMSEFETDFSDLTLEMALEILENGDFQQRWDLAKILPKFGETIIKPLLTRLEDPTIETEEKWFIIKILGDFNQQEVIEILIKILSETEDQELKEITITSLSKIGSDAIKLLTILLENPDSRYLATLTLAQIRSLEVINPLLTVVNDPDLLVRKTAIQALGSYYDPRVLPVLTEKLTDFHSIIRQEALIGLNLWIDQEELGLVEIIKPLLNDLNLEVCQQAAITLTKAKTPEVAEALFNILVKPTTPISLQITLIHSLAWLEIPIGLDYLQESLSQVRSEIIKEIISSLGRISQDDLKPQAGKILLDFFNSGHPSLEETSIKQELTQAWGNLAYLPSQKALVILKEDHIASVRLHAVAALKRFASKNQRESC
jgi:HEAT repeat protein